TVLVCTGAWGCSDSARQVETTDGSGASPCGDPAVRELVMRFGERLKEVSVLGPDSVVTGELRTAYGEMVDPTLLAAWLERPSSAPGRTVSSPWPERIDVTGTEPGPLGGCEVLGEVVYISSADSPGDAGRVPVTLMVQRAEDWRITSYTTHAS